jgi:hypothetical protein
MKNILYIYYIPYISQAKGVFNKLISQIKSSDNFKFLLLTCDNINLDYSNLDIQKISNNRLQRLKQIGYFLELYSKKYEVFIFRKFVYNPFILKSFKKIKKYYGTKIITEHHSKEIPEYLSKKEYKKIIFEYMGILWMKHFNVIDGIVGVTKEITEYEKKLYNLEKGFTVGNGIFPDASFYSGFKKYENNGELNLVISIGDYYPWHGIERLIKSIEKYKYLNIKLNILLGSNSKYIISLVKEKKYINLYINPKEERVKSIYRNSHLAISSLAVYKKNLNEATPLKSREYLLRGIPFIYGYKDTDITSREIDKYLFRVPNDDSLINFEKITKYLQTLSDDTSKKLHKFAINNISWTNKLKLLQEFANEC